jgi:hypothetical protein
MSAVSSYSYELPEKPKPIAQKPNPSPHKYELPEQERYFIPIEEAKQYAFFRPHAESIERKVKELVLEILIPIIGNGFCGSCASYAFSTVAVMIASMYVSHSIPVWIAIAVGAGTAGSVICLVGLTLFHGNDFPWDYRDARKEQADGVPISHLTDEIQDIEEKISTYPRDSKKRTQLCEEWKSLKTLHEKVRHY